MMIIKRREHIVPGLNMTSTADISFMLLIFFLVTSSMDVDKGIINKLPPAEQLKTVEATSVMKQLLLEIKIQPEGRLIVNDKPLDISKLRIVTANFIRSHGKKHIISLDASPDASYDTYFKVQNELVAAYNDVRNTMAIQRYGKSLSACTNEQRAAVAKDCPQRISEIYDLGEGRKQ
jgi:biopolymer transport protein ExbD